MCAKGAQSSAKSNSRMSSSIILVEATEIEDTSIGSEPDVDAFGQFFLSLSHHSAKEDGEECMGLVCSPFSCNLRWERGAKRCPVGLHGAGERWRGTLISMLGFQGSSRNHLH